MGLDLRTAFPASLPKADRVDACLLPHGVNRVLVTGGAGFIGGALMWRLLRDTGAKMFNLDKLGYASDLTNCPNNCGSWQFPEKLIPVVILKAVAGEPIPLYVDVQNVRERLYVEAVQAICGLLDEQCPDGAPHSRLITPVADRPGHVRRYAIDASKISAELGWRPRRSFDQGLEAMVRWSLDHPEWFQQLRHRTGYGGERIGLLVGARMSGLYGNFV